MKNTEESFGIVPLSTKPLSLPDDVVQAVKAGNCNGLTADMQYEAKRMGIEGGIPPRPVHGEDELKLWRGMVRKWGKDYEGMAEDWNQHFVNKELSIKPKV
jgi:hypothetical protein